MKRKGEISALQIFENIGRPLLQKEGYIFASIILDWAQIVGSQLADKVRPTTLKFSPGKRSHGTLMVEVNPGASLLVQHMEGAIIEKINTYYGYQAVSRMRMVQVPAKKTVQTSRTVSAEEHVKREVFQPDLSDIHSPDLQDALRRLATLLPKP